MPVILVAFLFLGILKMIFEEGIPEDIVMLSFRTIAPLVKDIVHSLKCHQDFKAKNDGKKLMICLKNLPKDGNGKFPPTIFHLLALIISAASKQQREMEFIKQLQYALNPKIKSQESQGK